MRSDPLLRGGTLGNQRQNQRVMVGMAQLAEGGRRDHPAFKIESPVTASNAIRQAAIDAIIGTKSK